MPGRRHRLGRLALGQCVGTKEKKDARRAGSLPPAHHVSQGQAGGPLGAQDNHGPCAAATSQVASTKLPRAQPCTSPHPLPESTFLNANCSHLSWLKIFVMAQTCSVWPQLPFPWGPDPLSRLAGWLTPPHSDAPATWCCRQTGCFVPGHSRCSPSWDTGCPMARGAQPTQARGPSLMATRPQEGACFVSVSPGPSSGIKMHVSDEGMNEDRGQTSSSTAHGR